MLRPELHGFLDHAATSNAFEYFVANRQSLFLDCNLLDAVPVTHGFFSLYLKPEAELRAALWQNGRFGALLDLMSVSQVSSPDQLGRWEQRSQFLPMISSGQIPSFQDEISTFRRLTEGRFQPAREVCLPLEARGLVQTNVASATLTDLNFSAHGIRLRAHSVAPAMIVLSQSHYHNWRARIDGRPTPLWRANYAFQALQVPPGFHEVRLEYVDWFFRIGLLISIATLAGIICAWLRLPSANEFQNRSDAKPSSHRAR